VTDDASAPPGESFLARRARLKSERQREARAAQAAPEPPAPPPAPAAEGEAPAKRVLTDADMPPLETLTADSDFSQFLSEGVSDALRRAALRKLFHLPAFNITDGLAEYDEDYSKWEKLGEMVSYQQRRLLATQEPEAEAASVEAAGDRVPEDAEAAVDEAARAAQEPPAPDVTEAADPEQVGEAEDDGEQIG